MPSPWLPTDIGDRLKKPHEERNLRTTYILTTAYVGAFLSREDDKRPPWFGRMRLAPVDSLPQEVQEHLVNLCRIICTKVRQAVTTEPSSSEEGKLSVWQSGILCMRVLWKALFATAAGKATTNSTGVPLLYMLSCQSVVGAMNQLLSKLWNETQGQFTTRENKYRGLKSRPPWTILENLEYEAFGKNAGFGLENPTTKSGGSTVGGKPASNLQDFLEETIAIRFAVDCLNQMVQDGENFLALQTKRKGRQPLKMKRKGSAVTQQLSIMKEAMVDSFAQTWTDDAELRSCASLVTRLVESMEGDGAHLRAATVASQLMLAAWKGAQPMFNECAERAISQISETHAVMGSIPAPIPRDSNDGATSQGFELVASSYQPPSADCQALLQSSPQAVLEIIMKVQAQFRGWLYRTRHQQRLRVCAQYCKTVGWPTSLAPDEMAAMEEAQAGAKKKKVRKVDPTSLAQEMKDYQPNVSKYLGGESAPAPPKMASTLGSTMSQPEMEPGLTQTLPGANRMTATTLAPSLEIRITADHRACADFFAVYMYNMYRRREIAKMWRSLSGAYEYIMEVFSELLEKNPSLKPMVESVSAQLKRGAIVGFDKAFIAKQQQGAPPAGGAVAPGKIRPADTELFQRQPPDPNKRPSTKEPEPASSAAASIDKPGAGQTIKTPSAPSAPSADKTVSSKGFSDVAGAPLDEPQSDVELSGDYLTQYLKEMDGDDSQFKDIDAAVIPFSTGTSPPRRPPQELLLADATAQQDAAAAANASQLGGLSMDAMMQKTASSLGADAKDLEGDGSRRPSQGSGRATPKRPRIDVPFCIQKLKPLWLPIKAHRFTAYRSKVLQLLPQKILAQYVAFEKQGHYLACVKLLESATPGSLNVLQPNTIVSNKPLLVETVFQLLVGYVGLCLKNQQSSAAAKLIDQMLHAMNVALKDLHPAHRTVLEAYLYDTALSVCYYAPTDLTLANKAESFYQQASSRYLKLGHAHRYCKCCLRSSAVLHAQGHHHEAEYFTQQALNKLMEAPASSLLVVCYHNLGVHTAMQQRIPDAVAHTRSFVSLLKQLSKLSNTWQQSMDNTQWIIYKLQELWPSYQDNNLARDALVQAAK